MKKVKVLYFGVNGKTLGFQTTNLKENNSSDTLKLEGDNILDSYAQYLQNILKEENESTLFTIYKNIKLSEVISFCVKDEHLHTSKEYYIRNEKEI
jgi:predicted RNA binding protein with dsRBD fold (UPF0201 family)